MEIILLSDAQFSILQVAKNAKICSHKNRQTIDNKLRKIIGFSIDLSFYHRIFKIIFIQIYFHMSEISSASYVDKMFDLKTMKLSHKIT